MQLFLVFGTMKILLRFGGWLICRSGLSRFYPGGRRHLLVDKGVYSVAQFVALLPHDDGGFCPGNSPLVSW